MQDSNTRFTFASSKTNLPKTKIMSTEKLIDKIKKLLAKANGTDIQAEADSFIAKANQLMLEHNLNMTDVEVEDDDDNAITGIRDYCEIEKQSWESNLLSEIAYHNFCKLVYTSGRKDKRATVTIIGSLSGIEMTSYTFNAAKSSIVRISNIRFKEYAAKELWLSNVDGMSEKDINLLLKHNGSTERKLWLKSYLLGAVAGLGDRFREDREAARKANSTGFGLVLSRNANAVDKHVNLMFENLRTAKAANYGRLDQSALSMGRKDGKGVSIAKGVNQSRPNSQKMIG